ncbi:hypothetical protein TRVL_07637 [Trypanosoma vivax]|nr:hypothetical protein TRVL_07637 [Trypanosoma vivax]
MHCTGSAECRHASCSNTPHGTGAARTHCELTQRHLKHPSPLACFRSLTLTFNAHGLNALINSSTPRSSLHCQESTSHNSQRGAAVFLNVKEVFCCCEFTVHSRSQNCDTQHNTTVQQHGNSE